MASLGLVLALAFIFISFASLPPRSDGSVLSKGGGGGKEMKFWEEGERESRSYVGERKMVVGSRPPGCENKCMSCRPCMAAVVVPVHRMKGFKALSSSSRGEEDSYYLLSWKCRCGNNIYQP